MTTATLRRIHRGAGFLGFLIVSVFWGSTVLSELFLDVSAIACVKRAIAWGLFPLCLTLALAGMSGVRLVGSSPPPSVAVKRRRTALIGATGLLVLVPCALVLNSLASAGQFGSTFTFVQGVELLAGALNLRLLWLNIQNGPIIAAASREVSRSWPHVG